jgi:DNA uptake protein ComE-like DNA-binding protein
MAPTSGVPRKRERLTNLSGEEKMNRRKLKNRIAAQTARDRKKAKMGVLEESIDQFESENESLHMENDELRHHNEQLLEENALLKKQLEEAKVARISSQPVAVGSAVSISGPQQWEQATAATLIWTLLTMLLKPSSETSSKTSILKQLDLNSNSISLETVKEYMSSEQLESLLELWKTTRKRAPP